MKWLLMSRNRGVHETSVSWPSSDKVQNIGAGWEAHRRSTATGGHTCTIFSFQFGAKKY